SSTYLRYTLAFSTGFPESPPDTSMVTWDICSDLAGAFGAGAVSCALTRSTPAVANIAAVNSIACKKPFIGNAFYPLRKSAGGQVALPFFDAPQWRPRCF